MDPNVADQDEIPDPPEQVQPKHGYPSVPMRRGRGPGVPMWSWAVLTLFLLTACVVFGTFTAGLDISERVDLVSAEEKHRPLLTASQFYQSLIDHNYDVAHSQLAPEVAATHTPTDLRGRWQILEEASGDITLELDLKSPKIEGAKAFLNRSLVPTKGDQYDINLGMEMFNGSWRIVDATPYIIPEP